MKKYILSCMPLLFMGSYLWSQPYTSWRNGNATSIDTPHESGIVLAGGGRDNDEAMKWMLQKANGGDVLVLRTSGSNGYNAYFFDELGVSLNSVETIRVASREAADDPYVAQRILEAEVLFFAGGDQTTYYDNWAGTSAHEAMLYAISEKKICVGGTSAGMAILGEFFYVPQLLGITSAEALSNPFHPNMQNIGFGDFLNVGILKHTITDTHFDNRNRAGRLMTFLAHMVVQHNIDVKAIACNERTAVCVDAEGIARVFGVDDIHNTYAYFLQSNCPYPENVPERFQAGQSLRWDLNREAVKVYRIKGDSNGSLTFDLNDWQTADEGQWFDWAVIDGNMAVRQSESGLCDQPVSVEEEWQPATFNVYPNPFISEVIITLPSTRNIQLIDSVFVTNAQGIVMTSIPAEKFSERMVLNASAWPSGTYFFCTYKGGRILSCQTMIKKD